MKRKSILFLAAAALVLAAALSGCGKNPSVRNAVKKKINDYLILGLGDYSKNSFNTAKVYFEQALKEASSIDAMQEKIYILQSLADINLKLEDYSAASNYLAKAFGLAKNEGIRTYDYELYFKQGKFFDRIAVATNDFNLALTNYRTALGLATTDEQRADIYNSIGITMKKMGRLDEAFDYIQRACGINEFAQDFDSLGDNYYSLGEIYYLKNQLDNALNMHARSLYYDKISENSSGIMENLKRMGMICQKIKKYQQALSYYRRALDVADNIGNQVKSERIRAYIDEVNAALTGSTNR